MQPWCIRLGKQVVLAVLLVATFVSGAEAGNRKFYLTQGTVQGGQALTACAKGYHMASLWEIFNVSALTYDTKLGVVLDDSGEGPSVVAGWIRTGFVDSSTNTPGEASCHVWKSSSSLDEGTLVNLAGVWQSTSTIISPWQASAAICSNSLHVWCVAGK
jgi:hypothetical protein